MVSLTENSILQMKKVSVFYNKWEIDKYTDEIIEEDDSDETEKDNYEGL